MDVLTRDSNVEGAVPWKVPQYIAVGLRWLEGRLNDQPVEGEQNA